MSIILSPHFNCTAFFRCIVHYVDNIKDKERFNCLKKKKKIKNVNDNF